MIVQGPSAYNVRTGVSEGNMTSRVGGMEKQMNADKRREGVKNPGNFAVVICTRSA